MKRISRTHSLSSLTFDFLTKFSEYIDQRYRAIVLFCLGLVLLTGLCLVPQSGCGSGEKSSSLSIVSTFYDTHDDSAFAAFIDTAQYQTRAYIKCRLNDYVSAASEPDTLQMAGIGTELDWLIPKYEELTAVSDLRLLSGQYRRWNQADAQKKRELDSALTIVCERGGQSCGDDDRIQHYVEDLRCLEIGYRSISDSSRLASVMSYLAAAFELQQQIDSTLSCLNLCREICRDLDLREQLGDCDLSLAKLLSMRRAEYAKAEQLLIEAYDCFQSVGHYRRIPYVYVQRAYIFNQTFQPHRSIEQTKRAMDGYQRSSDDSNEGYCAYLLAETYLEQGDLDSSVSYANRALLVRGRVYEELRTNRSLSDLAHSESTIGRLYRTQRKTAPALEQYEKSQRHFLEAADTGGLCLNLLRTGELLEQLQRFDEAEKVFREVISYSEQYETSIYARYGLAICSYRQDDVSGAIQHLMDCIAQLEETRDSLGSQKMKAGLLADKIGFYDLLITIYLERYESHDHTAYLDTALTYLQRRKARTLAEALGIEEESGSRSGRSSVLATLPPSLRNNEIVLEYQLSRFGCYVIVMAADTVALVPLAIDNDSLQSLTRMFLDSVSTYPGTGELSGTALHAARELYLHLVPGGLLRERATDHLILIPSTILHHLPVEALVDEEGQYLVEEFDVSYVPSTTTLGLLMNRKGRENRGDAVVAFGDPVYPAGSGFAELVHSGEEIAAIMRVIGPKVVRCFLAEQANNAVLATLDFSGVSCLHISAHGFCDFQNAGNSAIVLSMTSEVGGSGYLTSEEITKLSLPVELAFLSACRTGAGRILPGEGVMSLARPFLQAGCGAVVASSWNVDDAASADLVGQFYTSLKDGNSLSHSLALAKRGLISSQRALRPHPYFWAPYLLIGWGD